MRCLWKAEIINGRPLPWAARITGPDDRWGFKREFVHGIRDYTFGQEHHTRGVYLYFFLDPGLYEVYRPTSWKHEERYFIKVDDLGKLSRISREEITECLKSDTLESAS